jgi:hypothetical protein
MTTLHSRLLTRGAAVRAATSASLAIVLGAAIMMSPARPGAGSAAPAATAPAPYPSLVPGKNARLADCDLDDCDNTGDGEPGFDTEPAYDDTTQLPDYDPGKVVGDDTANDLPPIPPDCTSQVSDGVEAFIAGQQGLADEPFTNTVTEDEFDNVTIGFNFDLLRPDAPGILQSIGVDYGGLLNPLSSGAPLANGALTDEQVFQLEAADVAAAQQRAQAYVNYWGVLSPLQQAALTDVAFTSGNNISDFTGLINETTNGGTINGQDLAVALKNSAWAVGQDPARVDTDLGLLQDCGVGSGMSA